ncbi:MAG: hypothetical protein H6883_07800 [Rhodobiaceae bacterium]|nr:hypothetical protein [Rhodobiaceae bacterium]MCC0056024.1 hypothetical protein [Rhodobiaceae bacterium]
MYGRSICSVALMGMLALSMSGCASMNETAQQSAAAQPQPAPPDLKLVCARAVAIEFNGDPGKAVPISSAKGEGNVYQIVIALDQLQANCLVNSDGVVQSITVL